MIVCKIKKKSKNELITSMRLALFTVEPINLYLGSIQKYDALWRNFFLSVYFHNIFSILVTLNDKNQLDWHFLLPNITLLITIIQNSILHFFHFFLFIFFYWSGFFFTLFQKKHSVLYKAGKHPKCQAARLVKLQASKVSSMHFVWSWRSVRVRHKCSCEIENMKTLQSYKSFSTL